MSDIERSEVLDLLSKWESGELSAPETLENAERILDEAGWPAFSKSDPRAIALEVISQLEILNQQILTTRDIPAMRRFLTTPTGKESEGWAEWTAYLNGIDYAARRATLADDPFYA